MQTTVDLEYWLALLRAPRIGNITFARLVAQLGSPRALFEAAPSIWTELGLKADTIQYLKMPAWAEVEQDLAWLDNHPENSILCIHQTEYPALLRQIHDAPPVLFVRGQLAVLNRPQIAIVGSRNPTSQGSTNALHFAQHLAAAGFVITSGMALGIDAAAHQGALVAQGQTLAVAGNGLDRVYPPQHRELAYRIAEQGVLVSELPPRTPSKTQHFPRRNRIISGLSLGVLVVEASERSGSLITAHSAAEQGREVFAIPGSIHNPLARGCHALIKNGAKLVEKAEDILLEVMNHLSTREFSQAAQAVLQHNTRQSTLTTTVAHKPTAELSTSPINRPSPTAAIPSVDVPQLEADYQQLFDLLGELPIAVDTLVELSGLTAEAVSSMLLILELRGLVIAHPGGLYTRML